MFPRRAPAPDSPLARSTPTPAAAPARGHSFLTWPKALAGGVIAFLVLALSTAGWMGLRSAGIGPMGSLLGKGELEERDPIVLAQFTSAGGDTILASALTEAFRVDFEQSPMVRLVGPSQVRDVLRRMQRDDLERMTPELAREIAEREGYKAILTGEVNQAGGGWVLSARLESVDGRVLASARETAPDSTGVLTAIDGLSKALRERIGESLRTIRGNEPLDQVTTSSIAALRKYTQSLRARDEGDPFRAIELLEQAIELDPGFAMAWRKLAAVLSTPGMDRDRRAHAATRAWELRDRLTDKERHLAGAAYYAWVQGDDDAAIREYRSVLDLDPDETTALNNLSLILGRRGEIEEAARLTGRAAAIGGSAIFAENHADFMYSLGHLDSALATLERMQETYPENGLPIFLASAMHAGDGRYAVADSLLLDQANARRDPNMLTGYLWLQSSIDAVRGRLDDAFAHVSDWERTARQFSSAEALNAAIWRADVLLDVRGDTAAALRELDSGLARYPLAEMSPLQRPYVRVAGFLLSAGERELGRTRSCASASRRFQPTSAAACASRTSEVAVMMPLLDGDLSAAESAMTEFHAESDCEICFLLRVASAHADSGNDARAIELYERYLAERWAYRVDIDALSLAQVLERVGELYERNGDLEAAARSYGRFLELWDDADAGLQPRVRAVRNRLEAIVARRG